MNIIYRRRFHQLLTESHSSEVTDVAVLRAARPQGGPAARGRVPPWPSLSHVRRRLVGHNSGDASPLQDGCWKLTGDRRGQGRPP